MRGTSRTEAGLNPIREAGIDAVLADPAMPGTILDLVGDVAVVTWLLGSAEGGGAALGEIHGPKLERVLERLVETPVRGFVYEGAGSIPADVLATGRGAVERAAETWRIPVEIVDADADLRASEVAAAVMRVAG